MQAIEYKRSWDTIKKAITTASKSKNGLSQKFHFIVTPPTQEELANLTVGDRETIAATVEQNVIKSVTGITSAEIDKEFLSLSGLVRNNIEGNKNGYIAARAALFSTFGDVAGINDYYKDMKSADFPSVTSSVKGRSTTVHSK